MATAVSSTSLIQMLYYDNAFSTSTEAILEKYTSNRSLEDGNSRLRNSDSLQSIGFTFGIKDRPYKMYYEKIDPLIFLDYSIHQKQDSSFIGNPIFEDGWYILKDDIHLFPSNRLVKEKLNTNGVWSTGAYSHRCNYSFDPSFIDVRIKSRVTGDYKFDRVTDFTLLQNETSYRDGYSIYLGKVDTSSREFMVGPNSNNYEIDLNNNLSLSSLVTTDATDTGYKDVLYNIIPNSGTVLFPYYPVSTSQIYDTSWTLWTQISSSSFGTSTDKTYYLNEEEGFAILNTNIAYTSTIYIGWEAVPLVSYYMDHKWNNKYQAKEEDVLRLVEDVYQGSFFYTIGEENTSILDLNLTLIGGTEAADYWNKVYYNDTASKCKITILDSITKEPVLSEKVSVEIVDNKGKLIGSTNGYTNEDGELHFKLIPPSFFDGFIYSDGTGTSISSTELLYSTDLQNQYTYVVWKNDALLGTSNSQRRKSILYTYGTEYKSPVDTSATACFYPLHPSTSSGQTSFGYGSSLPILSTDTSTPYSTFAIIGPKLIPIKISTLNQTSTSFIYCDLRDSQKGSYDNLGNRYPLGWMLQNTSIDAANTLDAALYMTVNPYSGSSVVLFSEATQMYFANTFPITFDNSTD